MILELRFELLADLVSVKQFFFQLGDSLFVLVLHCGHLNCSLFLQL